MKRGTGKRFFKSKRGVVADYLPWIILAVVVLGIVLLAIFMMKDKGFAMIDKLKGIFTGR